MFKADAGLPRRLLFSYPVYPIQVVAGSWYGKRIILP